MKKFELVAYIAPNKKEPFYHWLDELDNTTHAVIVTRLHRLQAGNLGDCKQIKGGEGIWEFRIHYGAGYRIYWGKQREKIIILLCGGDKRSQKRDIEKAIKYWLDYKEQHE